MGWGSRVFNIKGSLKNLIFRGGGGGGGWGVGGCSRKNKNPIHREDSLKTEAWTVGRLKEGVWRTRGVVLFRGEMLIPQCWLSRSHSLHIRSKLWRGALIFTFFFLFLFCLSFEKRLGNFRIIRGLLIECVLGHSFMNVLTIKSQVP